MADQPQTNQSQISHSQNSKSSGAGGGLLREIRFWDAVAIGVGCIIGSGIFRAPTAIAANSSSTLAYFSAWIVGGFLSLCGGLTYAELSAAYPRAGGDYSYIRAAFGEPWGFLFGWTKLFIERTGTIAIIAIVFAEYACHAIGVSKDPATIKIWYKTIACSAILILTFANAAGLRFGKTIQNLTTAAKVGVLAMIILAGVFMNTGKMENLQPLLPTEWSFSFFQSIGAGLIFALFTYGGWTEAAYMAEESKDAERTVPRAIIWAVILTTGLYLAVNLVYMLYMPIREMAQTGTVAATVMERIFPRELLGGQAGSSVGRIISVMVMISAFGALNGYVLTGGRILFAISRDHAMFARLARVHPSRRTPDLALWATAGLSTILVLTGTFDTLVTYSTVAISIFFAMAGVALFVLRVKDPQRPRPYKVWGYPVVPALFIVMTVLYLGNALTTPAMRRDSLWGFGIVFLGLPLYFISEKLQTN